MTSPSTDPDSTEPAFTIISTTDEPILTASPKSILKKAHDLGWKVQVRGSVTHHEPVLMMSDGKDKQRGEVKTPAHDKTHIFMRASHPKGQVGFQACWTDGKFVSGQIIDPLGFEVENWADYSPASIRQVKDEPATAFKARKEQIEYRAQMMAYDYNDQTYRTEHRKLTSKATELTDWLHQWLAIVNPDALPKPKAAPKPKTAQPTEQDQALAPLQIGEWHE